MGIASLILGCLSLVTMFLVLFFQVSFGAIPTVMAIVGIIIGIMSVKNNKDKKAMIGLILCVMYFLIFVILAMRSVSRMKSQLDVMEQEMKYPEEKALEARENIDIKFEKEEIQLAISMAMFGDNAGETLTYDNLDEQLNEKFGAGNYTLTKPDSKGNFTLKIGKRVYIIDSNGILKK